MGGPGSGQLAKAVNNCLYDINCAALCEMLAAR
jgi:3-hydroxyisobutyrate dehydrogenase-like beta-hydroxyacid dehydrogenase